MEVQEDCVFCKIVGGEAEGCMVFEDELSVAFLDRRPLFAGHTLVVPRAHYETFNDLPIELMAPYFANVQLLSKAVERAFKADGAFVAANIRVSQSVPHVHFHVVPRRANDGLFARDGFWMRHPYNDTAEMLQAQESIRAALEALQPQEARRI
jgi:histidine triad (HIT) family protein